MGGTVGVAEGLAVTAGVAGTGVAGAGVVMPKLSVAVGTAVGALIDTQPTIADATTKSKPSDLVKRRTSRSARPVRGRPNATGNGGLAFVI